ncbi:rnapii degradation factor [Moniliophthora roreri]|nr:rnapii degradation factor [Moniliophthora roreri]
MSSYMQSPRRILQATVLAPLASLGGPGVCVLGSGGIVSPGCCNRHDSWYARGTCCVVNESLQITLESFIMRSGNLKNDGV